MDTDAFSFHLNEVMLNRTCFEKSRSSSLEMYLCEESVGYFQKALKKNGRNQENRSPYKPAELIDSFEQNPSFKN